MGIMMLFFGIADLIWFAFVVIIQTQIEDSLQSMQRQGDRKLW